MDKFQISKNKSQINPNDLKIKFQTCLFYLLEFVIYLGGVWNLANSDNFFLYLSAL